MTKIDQKIVLEDISIQILIVPYSTIQYSILNTINESIIFDNFIK